MLQMFSICEFPLRMFQQLSGELRWAEEEPLIDGTNGFSEDAQLKVIETWNMKIAEGRGEIPFTLINICIELFIYPVQNGRERKSKGEGK